MSERRQAPVDGARHNWGRWGEDDEIGSLNFLTQAEVWRGIRAVRQGKVFTLGMPFGDPNKDPTAPDRRPAMRFSVMDQGQFRAAKTPDHVNGRRFADDMILMFTHGATHIDALGHFWRGDFIYNGWPADSTTGGMDHADVAALASRGIVGRGVLVDVARDRGVDQLPETAAVSLEDLLEVARHQNVSIEPHDVLLVRTGWLGQAQRLAKQYAPSESELKQPGLRYSPALVDWFYQMEIPLLATDTITNECWVSVDDPLTLELHIGLMSNLGVLFCELTALDELAADCAADGQYDFLYAAAPLNILCATAGPANPIVVK